MMDRSVTIREFSFPDDYESTSKLWKSIESGINVGVSDSLEEIQKELQHDPNPFLVKEY